MSMKKSMLALLGLVVLISACVVPVNTITVRGSGSVLTEKREFKGIDSIQLGTLGKLEIIQGEEEGLEISAEENLLPYLLASVKGNALEIRTANNVTIQPTKDIIYTLKIKNLSGIFTSSLGSINASQLTTDKIEIGIRSSGDVSIGTLIGGALKVRISSSGNLTLAGKVASEDVEISSSGNLNGGDLQSQSASVRISSSGNTRIWVVNDLNAQISSSGNVDYYGSPKVTANLSSSGKVNSLGAH
jgi:hypothetical protein